jgi:iron complex outermembrane receptor protein
MRITLAVAVGCLVLGGIAAADDASAAIRRTTNIPAEGLGPALTTLAKEFDFQVLYRTEVVGTLRTQGVSGAVTAAEALEHVLSGTGLTYKYLDDKTVTIMPVGADAPSSNSNGGHDAVQSDETEKGSSQSPGGDPKKSFWDHFRLAQATPASNSGLSPQSSALSTKLAQADTVSTGSEIKKEQEQSGQIPEIIVTAQKREERLIDVPQSLTVMSAADLARLGATQFSDFANTVPGLSFQTAGPGFTSVTLRGTTTGYDISPTVGIYVDDVPIGSSTTFVQAAQTALDVGLFDLNRIEILRGPQGTLYGASTMGGLLKYVTTPPDTTAVGGNAQVGVSDTAHGGVNYNVASALNMVIVPNAGAVRLSGYESHDGGYIDNLARAQNDANRSDNYGGRVDLLFTPTDALSIRAVGSLQNISSDGEATVDYTPAGKPYGALGQYRSLAEPFTSRFRLGSLTVAYDFGGATLTSISSYQTDYESNNYDISSIYVPIFRSIGDHYTAIGLPSTQSTDKFTQEVRLASRANGQIEWLLGGFYNHESSYINQYLVGFVGRSGSPVPPQAPPDSSKYEESAGFGDLTWHLTQKFSVTGGLRVAHNDQSYTAAPNPTVRSSESVTTYLANARYQFNDRATAYLRYATGYRPGGPNIRLPDPVTGKLLGPAAFQADKLASYEGGFKAETSQHRFGFDFALYHINWSNIQVLAIQDGIAYRTNAPPGATVDGSELTLTLRPVDDLLVTGAFAYQHAWLDGAIAALGASEGERLPAVPRVTAAINGDYVILHNQLQPSVGATVRYVSDRLASLQPPAGFSSLYTLPSYTSVDLRTSMVFGSVNTQLYVHNLFDERGQLSDLYPQFGARIALIQPRTIGVLASVKF